MVKPFAKPLKFLLLILILSVVAYLVFIQQHLSAFFQSKRCFLHRRTARN